LVRKVEGEVVSAMLDEGLEDVNAQPYRCGRDLGLGDVSLVVGGVMSHERMFAASRTENGSGMGKSRLWPAFVTDLSRSRR
jgi:hypothetical protein